MNTTATQQAAEILARIDHLGESLEEQALVSQGRWVDHLLDLFNLIEVPALRRVVAQTLADISHLGAAEAHWMGEQLRLLAAAVEIESAFDLVAVAAR